MDSKGGITCEAGAAERVRQGPQAEATAPGARRRRRSRADVAQRIRDAARELFAEKGYAAVTTREIAQRADVSETLLFRYHGDKAGLYEEVVTRPFNELMDRFTALTSTDPAAPVDALTRQFTEQVFHVFEENRSLFRSLLLDSLATGPAAPVPGLGGIAAFFDRSVDHVSARYAQLEKAPPIDLAVGVRLGFGMIMSSVLLEQALFDTTPRRESVLDALKFMISRTLIGPDTD